MKKPCICFLGDENRCREVMNSFRGSAKTFFVSGNHIRKGVISAKQPLLLCFILEKGKSGHSAYYSEALAYSKKTKCPVYIVCSHDQFDGLRDSCPNYPLYKVTVSGMYRIIRSTIKFALKTPGAELELVKSRFEAVGVISTQASLASYCENKVCMPKGSNRRIVIAPSFENCHDFSGILITENSAGFDYRSIVKETASGLKIPVMLIGTKEKNKTPRSITYVSVKDDGNKIAEALRKYKKAQIRKISYC